MKQSATYPAGYAARLFKLHKVYMDPWVVVDLLELDPNTVYTQCKFNKLWITYPNAVELFDCQFQDGPKRGFLQSFVRHSLIRMQQERLKVEH